MRAFTLLFALALSTQAYAQQYIDMQKTLFGVEYSFQDEEIVKEAGRMTMTTPYKRDKLLTMLKSYVHIIGLPESAIEEKTTWKPGFFINVPGDGKYVINTEPVTVEFNTTPKTLGEIKDAATPIYEAAKSAGLKPYVNPAAERSGMGHIHVGGWKLQDSPFYKNENLLRNVLAFYHKHPSLLYGFAEAYDVGFNSNIESLHEDSKQNALEKIFGDYDKMVKSTPASARPNGMLALIDMFKNDRSRINWSRGGGFDGWFAHYRFINLEHTEVLKPNTPGDTSGKFTIEFRVFRPPPTAAHAEAAARLLVYVMDYLAKPGHLEKFEKVSQSKFANFFTGSKVQSDWELVKKELGIKNEPLLDEMVKEMVDNVHSKVVMKDARRGVEIFESYSEKEFKGKHFEIRFDASLNKDEPSFEFKGKDVQFEKVQIGGKAYWVSVVKVNDSGITVESFKASPFSHLRPTAPICDRAMLSAG